MKLLRELDKIPSFDPFLFKEWMAKIGRNPDDRYFELTPSMIAGMEEFVFQEISMLVSISLSGVESNQAVLRLVRKMLSSNYDDDLAPDLASVARMTGLSTETVINAHLAGDYAVFLYGFAPGYAYLGGVPKPIQLDRKPAAVRGVAAGSVIIAGPQCLVTTLTMPTGWWIIGRSPTQILTGDPERPFLFDVGDKVRFRRITRAEFASGGGA